MQAVIVFKPEYQKYVYQIYFSPGHIESQGYASMSEAAVALISYLKKLGK